MSSEFKLKNGETVLTVSDLNADARFLLEKNLGDVLVEGEISNLATPASGHIYFSLKDGSAQVRCAMFRNKNLKLKFAPENGLKVIVKARASLYEGRGEFQLIVETMFSSGEGLLQLEFIKLKEKLQKEGLFDDAHKKPLPLFPKRIAVITSATGAAIRDIVSVIERRYPLVELLIVPALVQGDDAAAQLCSSLQSISQHNDIDTIILSRGGGSAEDLAAFNDEDLARLIYGCKIPVVSGIGHEIDFTIADFVADVRAPTPSAAAEVTTPDIAKLSKRVNDAEMALLVLAKRQVGSCKIKLEAFKQRLQMQSPAILIENRYQKLDYLQQKLFSAVNGRITACRHKLEIKRSDLQRLSPQSALRQKNTALESFKKRLSTAAEKSYSANREKLALLSARLEGVSPLRTLQRGYSLALKEDGSVISNEKTVSPGEKINIRLSKGALTCKILNKEISHDKTT